MPTHHSTMGLKAAVGRFGVAYVRAVCAQAHLTLTEITVDEDALAIDATLDYAQMGVRVQIKATSKYSLKKKTGKITFPVKQSWLKKWAANEAPAYLVLVLVDKDVGKWHSVTEALSSMSAYALWHRVDSLPANISSLPIDRASTFDAQTIASWGDDLLMGLGISPVASVATIAKTSP